VHVRVGQHGGGCSAARPEGVADRDRVRYTWCAYDAVGIPAAIGWDASLCTHCPGCDGEIRLYLPAGQPPVDSPVVGWWPERSACTNVVQQFCPLANLFCSRDHLDAWHARSGQPAGAVLGLPALGRLGRQNWSEPDG
jgi:alkylmercury lyase